MIKSFPMTHTHPLPDDNYIPPELIGVTDMTHEQFEQVCAENRKLRLELTSTGELIIMPPTSPLTGKRNANLTAQLLTWAENDGSGVCFDSSTIFLLPNGAMRSPDTSWIRCEKWDSLSEQQKDRFSFLCPDFVVELRSRSDRLPTLLNKMEEFMEN